MPFKSVCPTGFRCASAVTRKFCSYVINIPIGSDRVRSSRVEAPGPNNEYLGRWLVKCVGGMASIGRPFSAKSCFRAPLTRDFVLVRS